MALRIRVNLGTGPYGLGKPEGYLDDQSVFRLTGELITVSVRAVNPSNYRELTTV